MVDRLCHYHYYRPAAKYQSEVQTHSLKAPLSIHADARFLLGLAGLSLTYGAAFGLDMGVGFLVLCLVSKLWELYKRRDAYVVLNLSLFVIAGLFLLDQVLSPLCRLSRRLLSYYWLL